MVSSVAEINPTHNIQIRNIWHMLVYAWDILPLGQNKQASSEPSPDLLGLMARVLANSPQKLVRRQIGRQYVDTISPISGIRGRIRFTRSLHYIGTQQTTMVCQYSDLSINTLRNQIIKTTLIRLLHSRHAKSGWSEEKSRADALNRDISMLIKSMDAVSEVRITKEVFSRLQLGRSDRLYVIPLKICELIYKLNMPSQELGRDSIATLLNDEITFSDLYERFVRNFYRHHLKKSHRVSVEILEWPDMKDSPYVPKMKTDISITELLYPHNRLIIDTKFYQHTLTSRWESSKLHSENLYQIYAYLRTQEDNGPSYRNASGMLLYPVVETKLNEKLHIQGHDITIATINLLDEWEVIEENLLNLIEI